MLTPCSIISEMLPRHKPQSHCQIQSTATMRHNTTSCWQSNQLASRLMPPHCKMRLLLLWCLVCNSKEDMTRWFISSRGGAWVPHFSCLFVFPPPSLSRETLDRATPVERDDGGGKQIPKKEWPLNTYHSNKALCVHKSVQEYKSLCLVVSTFIEFLCTILRLS